MLNCELCDYYKVNHTNDNNMYDKTSFCEFSGFIFHKDPEELDMDYPCSNISYDQYLNNSSKKHNIYQVEYTDWRFTYLRTHKKPLKDKRRLIA